FISESFIKHRTDWTVDQSSCQSGNFRRASFTFDKAAGYLPCSIHFLFIIDGQREKISCTCFLTGNCCCQNNSLTVTDQNSAICLFCQLSCFNDQWAVSQLHLIYFFFCHLRLLLSIRPE